MALKTLARVIALLVLLSAEAWGEARPGERLREHALVDQNGKPVTMSAFHGKPLVLSFVYSSCAHTCGTLTESLRDAFEDEGLGVRFNAMTVGFDGKNDTPKAMKEYGGKFSDDFFGWTFASANDKTIGALTAEAGFYYKKTTDGFDHPNLAIVIGPDGRLFKRLYGNAIDGSALMKAVLDSRDPEHEGYRAREPGFMGLLKYVCYTYDEKTGTYRIDFTFLMIVALGVIVQLSFVWFIIYIKYSLKKKGQ